MFARVVPLVRILKILDHIGVVRAKKPLKKRYFVDAESVRKTYAKILNLTTTNAILMKLPKIMYFHESVNRKALRAKKKKKSKISSK